MENFVHLHAHSCYSVADAISTPEDLVKKAVEHGHQAMALTDHGAMGGCFVFQQACLKAGIKPIIGTEGYVVKDLVKKDDKGKRIREKNNHIILLAKNDAGYKSLLRLNYLSNSDDNHFYYKPRFSFKELFDNKEGLVVSSACIASGFANLLKRGMEDEAEKMFEQFVVEFKEDFYAEVQLNEINFDDLSQKQYNDWLIAQATHYGVPIVLTGDVHYANPDGAISQEFYFGLKNDDDKEVGERFACHSLYYQGIDDFKSFNEKYGYNYPEGLIDSWCANTVDVAKKIEFQIPLRTKMFLPRQAFDEDDEITKKAVAGLCRHLGVEKFSDCPKAYQDRLLEEIKLIIKKGVSRYFLCLDDICGWCDKNNVSRGQSRGCFLPGNPVSMADGTFKKIKDVKEGEMVLSGFSGPKKVEKVFSYDFDELATVIYVDKKPVSSSTLDHKIWIKRDGKEKWMEASKIFRSDFLNINDKWIHPDSIISVTKYKGKVYDLKIEGEDHSYRISNMIVHNSVGGSLVACCLGLIGWIMDPVKTGLLFSRFISDKRLTDCVIDYSKQDGE